MNKITNIIFSFLFIFLAIFLAKYHLGIEKSSFAFLNSGDEIKEIDLKKENDGFKFGLDLIGGSYLVYNVDVSKLPEEEIEGSVNQLKSVIQKRLNAFGTGDASVTIQKPSIFVENKKNYKMIVEIPGVSDATEAKNKIGSIPTLVFKRQLQNGEFEPIGLSGKHIKSSSYGVSEKGENEIYINFNDEGKKIFGDFTTKNVGVSMGIFMKENANSPEVNISTSTIVSAITGGSSRISGSFSKEYAKGISQNLNNGAVSVPLSIESTDTISPTLGKDILFLGMKAAF
jgi:preprotein translocase subunit SecD